MIRVESVTVLLDVKFTSKCLGLHIHLLYFKQFLQLKVLVSKLTDLRRLMKSGLKRSDSFQGNHILGKCKKCQTKIKL